MFMFKTSEPIKAIYPKKLVNQLVRERKTLVVL